MGVQGIDVHGEKTVSAWRRVRAAGNEFVWLKATEGKGWNDDEFSRRRVDAAQAGLRVGAYHWARPDLNSAADEAAHFLRVAKPKRGELLPALDFEEPKALHLRGPALVAWAAEWLSIVEKAIGARPIFYSYSSYISSLGDVTPLSRYFLWLANYGPNDGTRHAVSAPRVPPMVAHQYTSRGSVAGVLGWVDCNFAPYLEPLLYRPGLLHPARTTYRYSVRGSRAVVQAARRAVKRARAAEAGS